jgi:uncharacterized Zn-finger protein
MSNLIKHTCIHSGERPYVFSMCNIAFSHQPDMIRHQRIHTAMRPYVCYV